MNSKKAKMRVMRKENVILLGVSKDDEDVELFADLPTMSEEDRIALSGALIMCFLKLNGNPPKPSALEIAGKLIDENLEAKIVHY